MKSFKGGLTPAQKSLLSKVVDEGMNIAFPYLVGLLVQINFAFLCDFVYLSYCGDNNGRLLDSAHA